PVALKLTGGLVPMLALAAWPHANIRGGSLATVVLDIAGLTLVTAFLFWSLIVVPGLTPTGMSVGMRSLVVVGISFHAALVASFGAVAFVAGAGPWRMVYTRLAAGAALGSLILTANVEPMAAGTYSTGAVGDIGWILPFWFYAWAASEAPASPATVASPVEGWSRGPRFSPLLLAVAAVPIVGYVPGLVAPLDVPI